MMGQRHMLDDGQAQSHAIRRAIALFRTPIEPLEDARLILLSDARALVDYANHHTVAILVFGCGHADHAIFLGIADGVFDELGHGTVDLVRLTIDD